LDGFLRFTDVIIDEITGREVDGEELQHVLAGVLDGDLLRASFV